MPFNLSGMGDAISELGRKTIDPLYKLRYGMGQSDKSRLALSGTLPGAPQPGEISNDEAFDKADRVASGYLFGKKWGANAKPVMDVVNVIRTLTGDSPELRGMGMNAFQEGTGEKLIISPISEMRRMPALSRIRRTY